MANAIPDLPTDAFRRHLSIIMLVALVARVAMFVFAWQSFERFDFPDSHRYIAVARNILAGQGPIDSSQVLAGTDPLYPYLIAVGDRLGITSDRGLLLWARAIASLAGLCMVPLLALFARRVTDGKTALLAAGWLAIDPMMLFFGATALTELPFAALLLAGSVALARGMQERRLGWVAISCALFGLGTVTRSTALFLPLVFAPCAILALRAVARNRASTGIVLGLMIAAYAATLAPVVIRQHRVLNEWRLPMRTGGGASLLEALGPWADGAPGMDRIEYPTVPTGANELERDRIYRQHAIKWAGDHPARMLELAWAKVKRTWSIRVNAADYQSPLYAAIAWLTVAPIFALAIVGAWHLRRSAVLLLLLAPATYFTLVHMVFVGSIRYRVPAMPFLFILAAFAANRLMQKKSGTAESM